MVFTSVDSAMNSLPERPLLQLVTSLSPILLSPPLVMVFSSLSQTLKLSLSTIKSFKYFGLAAVFNFLGGGLDFDFVTAFFCSGFFSRKLLCDMTMALRFSCFLCGLLVFVAPFIMS